MAHLALDLRSLALLLEQGLPIQEAVGQLASGNSPEWQKTVERMRAGAPLQEAADWLPAWLVQLLQSPERLELPQLLRRSAGLLDERQERLRFWRSVLIYPLLLWFACVCLGALMSSVSRSQFVVMGMAHSRMSQILTEITGVYLQVFPLLLAMPLLLGLVLRQEALRARLPIIGASACQREATSFLAWLELALSGGRALPEALETAAAGCVIEPVRREVLNLAELSRQGSSLQEASLVLTLWPPLARWALAESEKSGFHPATLLHLQQILAEKSRFYQVFMATMVALAVYLVAAGMVLWCAACALVPMLNVLGPL